MLCNSGIDFVPLLQHFLVPLMESLKTPYPMLSQAEVQSVFSNFTDIWNFHQSFYQSLSELLFPPTPLEDIAQVRPNLEFPPLSPLLQECFPWLKLYMPFSIAFEACMRSLTHLRETNPAFAEWMKGREASERLRQLSLVDWLLTIIQRLPRYVLLLKVSLMFARRTHDSD